MGRGWGRNMLRPRIEAPNPSMARRPNVSSGPVSPSSFPIIARKVFVGKNHWNISGPRTPSGFSRLWSAPALKPSSETLNPATFTFGH